MAAPLVLVSNRGPVTYQDDGSVKRGTGGLVTALTGLGSHRDAVWIAATMTHGDQGGAGVLLALTGRQQRSRGRPPRRDRGRRGAGRDGPRLPPLHAAGDDPP